MNNIEANKIIDSNVKKYIVNFSLSLSKQFDSYSDLLKFLKKEKTFWIKQSSNIKTSISYDLICQDAENFIIELRQKVKENINSISELMNIIQSVKGNNFSATIDRYSNDFSMYLAIVPSDSKDIKNIIAAYKIFSNENDSYNHYLYLIQNPNYLYSYLNDNNSKAKSAYLFLSQKLKEINGDSSRYAKQIQNLIDDLQTANSSYSESVEENKKDLIEYIDNAKTDFDEVIQNEIELNSKERTAIGNLLVEKSEKFKDLEEAYEQKLHLEAPIMFWNNKSKEYAKNSRYWFIASIVVSAILMVVGTYLVHMIYFNPVNSKNEVITLIPKSFVLVAIVSLLVYILRVFIKVANSNNHLSLEYAQKAALTDFYLSLLQYESETINENDKTLIYSTLFSKVDTGLIKGTESSDIEKMVLSILSKQG